MKDSAHNGAYHPAPILTGRVSLSKDLAALRERLAESAHDVWARGRMTEGWTLGSKRDTAKKRHPNLVPFHRLPNSEKEFDRSMVAETLKGLLAMGYRIEKGRGSLRVRIKPGSGLQEVMSRLQEGRGHTAQELLSLWEARTPEWATAPKIHALLAERALDAGEPVIAYDVLRHGLELLPRDVRMRQLIGLAMARLGAPDPARIILQGLCAEGHKDEETLSLLARTYKDLAFAQGVGGRRAFLMRQSHACYNEAFRRWRGIYSGINAAATALMGGKASSARRLAVRVRALCLADMKDGWERGPQAYWTAATLGEAELILGRWAHAEECYLRASRIGRGGYGRLNSTRLQARRLMCHLASPPKTRIEGCFPVPRVVAFTGHMIDVPGRRVPRFPPVLEGKVREAIDAALRGLSPNFGFSSAACGSDILFLESMLARGAEIEVVLPVPPSEMRKTSVELVPGGWGKRFDRVISRASRVHVTSPRGASTDPIIYSYCNHVLDGLARLKAEHLGGDAVGLAVWDSSGEGRAGGTGELVRLWQAGRRAVDIIDLRAIRRAAGFRDAPRPFRKPRPVSARSPAQFSQAVKALLFADVVGFSSIPEAYIPVFNRRVLGLAAELMTRSRRQPETRNVWGDALYLGFARLEDAGLFALDLTRRIAAVDWPRFGLPERISLRVGLHAGPVYAYVNPFTRQRDYTGTHVSRAARLEPITPPEQVYASQEFAAMASSLGIRSLRCEYVGQIPMPKGYGIFPTYHVRSIPRGGD